MATKVRLDQLLVQRGLAETRARAQALILAGEVWVNGVTRHKAGELIPDDAEIKLLGALPYVGRGGYKLAHALDTFALSPANLTALDVGASTGGFTDVLLQRGATRVYAVDVGYGQIDWRCARTRGWLFLNAPTSATWKPCLHRREWSPPPLPSSSIAP